MVSTFKDSVLTGSEDDEAKKIITQLLMKYYYAPSA